MTAGTVAGRNVTVSVVMAVRNGQRHLDSALSSILRQTFADFELIVVDDGSDDGSGEVMERLRQQDGRITVIRQPPQGLAAALNRGVAAASGRYVARHDADDLSLPHRLEAQVRFLAAHTEVAAVGARTLVIDDRGSPLLPLPSVYGPSAVRAGIQRLRATPVHGSVMMRKEAFVAAGGYRTSFRVAQDVDLWLRLLERADIDILPETLYHWRLTPEGVYSRHRLLQLKYSGIALAFAAERAMSGADSYALLTDSADDLDRFAMRYRLRGLLEALWGDVVLRGLNDVPLARQHFARAMRYGSLRPRTVALFLWTLLGLPWPGRRPLLQAASS